MHHFHPRAQERSSPPNRITLAGKAHSERPRVGKASAGEALIRQASWAAAVALAALCVLPPASSGQDLAGVDGVAGVGLELGPAWFSRNDVRIPGDDGTKFDMLDLTGNGPDLSVRLDAYWNINDKHGLRLVLAPLEVSGTGNLDRPTEFAGTLFPVGRTKGTYNFSTYRLTYRYTWRDDGAWRWRVGATALVRDANVELQQGSLKDNNDDLGLVPLLHLSGDYAFADRWLLALEFDGLAGGPGRAFDIAVKVHHDLGPRWRVGGGYRMLEGGVDSDDVYNFSWIHFGVLSAQYRF